MPNIWLAAVRIFLSSMVSPNLWGRYCGELAPCALWVEAEPACSEPSVGGDLRIFTGGRRSFGAAAPLSTRASLLHYLVRADPACSKQPAGDDMRIFMGERCVRRLRRPKHHRCFFRKLLNVPLKRRSWSD